MPRKKRKAPAGCGHQAKKRKSVSDKPCVFCDRAVDDEKKFLKKLSSSNLTAHYFCLLFSSGLTQQGRAKDGIMGFMPKDICREMKRGAKLRCMFCKTIGATVGCSLGKCRVTFHFPCGLENGALFQFFDMFRSFCEDHQPQQDVIWKGPSTGVECAICMTEVEPIRSPATLITPCCRKAWFHRKCVQSQAWTAGLHFCKCPICLNKDQFQKEIKMLGIYVPDRDAAWELEPNAFEELLERHEHCDNVKCICPNGRDHNAIDTKWELLLCDDCGSQGSHMACAKLKAMTEEWVCPGCTEINKKMSVKKRRKKTSVTPRQKRKAETKKALEEKGHSEYPGPSGAMNKTCSPRSTPRSARSSPRATPCAATHKTIPITHSSRSPASDNSDVPPMYQLPWKHSAPRDLIITDSVSLQDTVSSWLQENIKPDPAKQCDDAESDGTQSNPDDDVKPLVQMPKDERFSNKPHGWVPDDSQKTSDESTSLLASLQSRCDSMNSEVVATTMRVASVIQSASMIQPPAGMQRSATPASSICSESSGTIGYHSGSEKKDAWAPPSSFQYRRFTDDVDHMFSESSYDSGSVYIPSCGSDISGRYSEPDSIGAGFSDADVDESVDPPSTTSGPALPKNCVELNLPGISECSLKHPPISMQPKSTIPIHDPPVAPAQTQRASSSSENPPIALRTACPANQITILSSSEDEDIQIVSVNFGNMSRKKCTCHLGKHINLSNEKSSAIDLTDDWRELHAYIAERKRLAELDDSDVEIISNASDDSDLYVVPVRGPIQMYPIRTARRQQRRPLSSRHTSSTVTSGQHSQTSGAATSRPSGTAALETPLQSTSASTSAKHSLPQSSSNEAQIVGVTSRSGTKDTLPSSADDIVDLSRSSPTMPVLSPVTPLKFSDAFSIPSNLPNPPAKPLSSASLATAGRPTVNVSPMGQPKQTAVVQPFSTLTEVDEVDLTDKDSCT